MSQTLREIAERLCTPSIRRKKVTELENADKRMLGFLVGKINETYRFKATTDQPAETAE